MNESIRSRREILRELVFEKSPTNASLWLHKYLREQKVEKSESTAKQDLVDQVSQIEVPTVYADFFENTWKMSLDACDKRYIELTGRMIVGLGSESVLETSITLHRIYGVPYIPGSALKGLASNYAHRFLGADWAKTRGNRAIGKAHELMFGSQESAGHVIFHDALYVPNSYANRPSNPLEPDVLTVHHPKYYQGDGSAPTDWDSPIPIPLLSAQGAYLLAVSSSSGDALFDQKMTDLAIQILDLAFRDEGVGAKTSSGYGRGRIVQFSDDYYPAASASSLDAESSIQSETVREVPLVSAEERAARKAQLIENIRTKLENIGDYEPDSRKKFKKIVKDDLSRLEGEMKQQAANLIADRARLLSNRDDDSLSQAEWFVEVREIAG